jgi:hypothetical protein
MGADAFWHAKMAQLITNTGFVPPFEIIEGYFHYSIFHIFASTTQTVCQIDIKDALFCSICLVSIISTIFIYLIGKKLAGPQVGLLATLLANVSDTIIVRGITNINPGSLVLCYFLLILYLVFKEKHRVINGSLIILITLLAVISHQLSTFVCFICLASIYVGKSAYKIVYKHKESVIITISYVLLFAVAMQSYWMYTYAHPGQPVFDWLLGPLLNVLQSGTEFGNEMAVTHAAYYSSTLPNILFHLGYLILLFFAIGGALFWLSSKEDKKISIVAVVTVLYIFVYAIPAFAINNMLPGRWFPILYVFLVMLASAYLFKIIQLIKFNPNKTFAVFSIIVIISFFMITTPNINKDNPMYAKERCTRNMFKASEISAITTINDMYSGTIKVDASYTSGLFRQMTIRSTLQSFGVGYITHPDMIEKKGTLILLRSSGFSIGRKYQSLPKEFLDTFKSSDYDLVYNNGEAWAYISK